MEPVELKYECRYCKPFVAGYSLSCGCKEGLQYVDGICVEEVALKNWPNDSSTYTITYDNKKEIPSQFLKANLVRGILFCKVCKLISISLKYLNSHA